MNSAVKSLIGAALLYVGADNFSQAALPKSSLTIDPAEVSALLGVPQVKPEYSRTTENSIFSKFEENEKFFKSFRDKAALLETPQLRLGLDKGAERDLVLDYEGLKINFSQWLSGINYYPRPRLKDSLVEGFALKMKDSSDPSKSGKEFIAAIFDKPVTFSDATQNFLRISSGYPEGSLQNTAFTHAVSLYNEMLSACADVAIENLKKEEPQFGKDKVATLVKVYALSSIYMRIAVDNIKQEETRDILNYLHYEAMLSEVLKGRKDFVGDEITERNIMLAGILSAEKIIGDSGAATALKGVQHMAWRPEYIQSLFDEVYSRAKNLESFFDEAGRTLRTLRQQYGSGLR